MIVHWLTPDLGRIATVAKGARRTKSPFLGRLDLFYEAQFSFIRSRKSELHTLKEVVLGETHSALRRDFVGLSLVSYFTLLIELATETETPVAEVWELFRGTLRQVSRGTPGPMTLFNFEMQFLGILGFGPLAESSGLSAAGREQLKGRNESSTDNPRSFKEINRFLQSAVGRAFERVPPQRLEVGRLLGL